MYFTILSAFRFILKNSKAIFPEKLYYYYCGVSSTRGSVLVCALLPFSVTVWSTKVLRNMFRFGPMNNTVELRETKNA